LTQSDIISLNDRLQSWLRHQALPFWDHHGVDRTSGGYFEQLQYRSQSGWVEASGASRRGRVVARQLFVFDLGHRIGWRSSRSDPVEHGCDYLFSTMYRGQGLFYSAVSATTGEPQEHFSLYEQAFYLFALARLQTSWHARFPLEETALLGLGHLRRHWGKPNGGFEEASPPTLPLKSNPQMHLLEAALEWIKAASASKREPWVALARELVGLCLEHFIDAGTGAVREYFATDWRAAPGEAGRILEPGHQFEWGWLLMQWAESPECRPEQRAPCRKAAERLVELGERAGVDPVRGVAVNELWDDLSVKDAAAKLWPQTERLKAWCAMLDHAPDAAAAERACAKIAAAAQSLAQYLTTHPAGMWQEVLLPEGTFTAEPCKASSFYHIAGALHVLQQTSSRACEPVSCGVGMQSR
jgi:mannose/cellobiose epimerase-like protein (N-acyl-D-glucosamine 2-epimerase family)